MTSHRQIMDAAWDEVFNLKARIEQSETLRKAGFALTNPKGRNAIRMTPGEVIALVVIAGLTGLMMGWIGA